ncbi:type II toxin-antitoxin system VapC family toxin [Bifidobacterium phasiani]|uniref:Ribonuclease VapC n=1 Tax=Bifidobacterium phasiani TaxID=2834431 RepID=A0ABS6WAH7_9BIFI|nr:type II toxin-antitoxin system VapC family toxin [Bifidobacterium phasiani]MBW3082756.1 type II toxin-antitoxin system VapC family toxin [Bifidobacterium phasiani]
MIVLDTNVLSELVKPHPSPAVVGWLANQQGVELAVTTVTVAELFYGLELMPRGKRRTQLTEVLDHLLTPFLDTLLSFDAVAALRYGAIKAERDRSGHPISVQDAMIAGIALAHHASVATRNTKDFAGTAVDVANPWETGPDAGRLR